MRRLLVLGAAVVLLGGCSQKAAPTPTKAAAHPQLDPSAVVQFSAATFSEGFDGGVQGPTGSNWWVNEEPSHTVSVSDFQLDASEVTVAQYATFLGWSGGPGHFAPLMPVVAGPTTQDFAPAQGADSLPIAYVTWFDARAYCLWMGGDLPTEAQWELAAKGAEGRVYPWEPDAGGPTCEQAVFFTGDVSCANAPTAVATHPAGDTPEGVHDMAGNVAEWTLDAYDAYPSDMQSDPTGPDAGPMYGAAAAATLRVIRGGGYRDVAISLRTTNRWGADAALRSPGVGFRCAYP
jgi:formylglycine-generating enzyme required for sulfatase activity